MEIDKPCLCCSGKLYKDCCKNKLKIGPTESSYKAYMAEFDKLHNKYKKICMHPDKKNCSDVKTHAHTISQKAVLELIANNKYVLMPVELGISRQFKMQKMPIEAKATKFYCFCSRHDGIFSPIDRQNVEFTVTNCFLYAYRTFASTYYKIDRELGCFYKLREKYDLTINPVAIITYIGMQRNLYKLNYWKEKFDRALIQDNYDVLDSIMVEIDYRTYFAAATCFTPMFDLYGNPLPWDDDDIPLVFISVIPNPNSTRVIFSWFKECSKRYNEFKNQLGNTPRRLVMKYLNNMLPLNCENMVIGPLLWEKWSKEARTEFVKIVSEHLIDNELKYYPESYFVERKYNLFEKIDI